MFSKQDMTNNMLSSAGQNIGQTVANAASNSSVAPAGVTLLVLGMVELKRHLCTKAWKLIPADLLRHRSLIREKTLHFSAANVHPDWALTPDNRPTVKFDLEETGDRLKAEASLLTQFNIYDHDMRAKVLKHIARMLFSLNKRSYINDLAQGYVLVPKVRHDGIELMFFAILQKFLIFTATNAKGCMQLWKIFGQGNRILI